MYKVSDDYVKQYKERYKTDDKSKWETLLPIDTEDFYDYIEGGVRDLVRVFIELGFYPISSCEGHPGGRMVRLGFNNDQAELESKLLDLLEEAKSKGILFAVSHANKAYLHDQTKIDKSIRVIFPNVNTMKDDYRNLVDFLKSKKEPN